MSGPLPHTLGIDIGGTNVRVAVVDDDGRPDELEGSGWSGGAPEECVSVVSSLVERVGPSGPLAVAGCGCAGLVDHDHGIVTSSPNLPLWRDVPLGAMLSSRLDMPVIIENDANAAAYGEYAAGAAAGARNAVMLTLGTGLGAGFVLGGRLYRGSHGLAAEYGHTTIEVSGEPCACGGSGCLENLVSAGALTARARRLIASGRQSSLGEAGDEFTAAEGGRAASSGDAVALDALAETGRYLGVGLANLVRTLDPDVVVIGGGVAGAGQTLLTPAREELERRLSGCPSPLPRLVFAELGNAAGVVGAALLARASLAGS
ncbi:MAG: ROK family protein [Candidatus Eisenbacteria bacterium]|nr:ROK family protein [Candidatus Eisenbacteria bacterium]